MSGNSMGEVERRGADFFDQPGKVKRAVRAQFGALPYRFTVDAGLEMDMIERNFAIGVFFSASPSKRNYAPKSLVNVEKGKNRLVRMDRYARIMGDLINEKRIVSEQYGSPRDDKWRLKVTSRTAPARSCV